MMMLSKQTITHNLLNILGWRTKRKIVVIESDDWGSVRMPSREAYEKLLKAGIRVDKCHYCSNDSIASEIDLSHLFEMLYSVVDKNNHSAVITANVVVANPDFKKIRDNGFEKYYFTKITDGLSQIKGCENSLKLWKEGYQDGCFIPQSHGREHLNVSRWMYYLRNNYQETRLAFDLGVYGISQHITSEKRKSFLPAFDYTTLKEEEEVNLIAADGLRIFENILGFRSISFIAPNYIWGKSLEKILWNNGVKYIQGTQLARYKNSESKNNRCRIRYNGKRNVYGMIDLARNAMFEPSANPNKDWVDSCLADINIAFRWMHPAVICSHRVNFVGGINIKNRDQNLKLFSRLLKQIKQKWPDVEFMSSDQLGELIKKDKKWM